MSLILDALNRADQERREERGSINLHPTPAAGEHDGERNWLPWLLTGIVSLLLLAVVVWALLLPANLPPATVLPDTPATRAQGVEADTTSTTTTPGKAVAVTASGAKLSSNPEPGPSISTTDATPQPDTQQAAIASLYMKKNRSAETNDTTKPTPAIKIKPRPDTKTILQSIPLLAEQSLQFQRAIPSIDYSLHMHGGDNAGLVTLNGQRLRVGGEVSPDLRVIAILEDSVVLDYKGRQFRLTALNSWVNFE